MTVRVERIGDRLGILLTEQEIAQLCLKENDPLELKVVDHAVLEMEKLPRAAVAYATTRQAMEAYKRTEPVYAEVYKELAK